MRYCIYRNWFKEKSHIKNSRLSRLPACQNVQSAGREQWCRVSWLQCQDVLWYCIYRKQFKDKNFHIKNRRPSLLAANYVAELVGRVPKCRVSWPRDKMSSQLAVCLDVESVDRELCCRDIWPHAKTFCDIVYIGNVLRI